MMLKNIYNYLRGDVKIEISGMRPERILNKLKNRGIEMWRIEHISETSLCVSLCAKDYRAIRPILRRSGCRVRLVSRRGLLYTARRVRTRYIILTGLLFITAAAFYMNGTILHITVTGCEKLSPDEVVTAMERAGVGIFTRTKTVDASDLRNEILLDMPELIWFTVYFKGSRAYVDVRERTVAPKVIETEGAADIVADYNGVITKMQIYSGEAAVNEGKAVYKGDILVSGDEHLRMEERVLETRARADIWARVWNDEVTALPLEKQEKIPTGRARIRLALVLGKRRINFYKNCGNPFDRCDKITKRYILGEGMGIAFEAECFYEYDICVKNRDEDSSVAGLTSALRRETLEKSSTLLSQKAWTENGWLFVETDSECERKIGKTVMRET